MGGGEITIVKNCRRNRSTIGTTAPGGPIFSPPGRAARDELTPELQKYLHILGPMPRQCLETLVDLGLTDVEIGRYFRMPSVRVSELREIWDITGP